MPVSVERYLSNLPLIAILRQAPWGFSTLRVFASDTNVSTTFSDVWEGPGSLVYPTASEALELVSLSADDDAAGTGARTVVIEGLTATYEEQSETVVLDGTTPVALVNSYFRINAMRVVTAGTGEQAAGTLTLRVTGAGATRAVISPGPYNVSLSSHFTIPANRTAYIIGAKYVSDDETTRFSLQVRELGTVFQSRDVFQTDAGPIGPPFFIPVEVQEKSDIKIVARRPTAPTALVFVSYDLVVAPKSLSAIRSLGAPAV